MKYFYAIVHKDQDSAFGVEFPDIPGVYSAADTMEHVLPNAVEALDLYFEDAHPCQPSSAEEVRHTAAKQLADGAFLLAVPWIENYGRLARVNISMESGMLAAIDQFASSRKLSRSAFLAQAARNEIEGRH